MSCALSVGDGPRGRVEDYGVAARGDEDVLARGVAVPVLVGHAAAGAVGHLEGHVALGPVLSLVLGEGDVECVGAVGLGLHHVGRVLGVDVGSPAGVSAGAHDVVGRLLNEEVRHDGLVVLQLDLEPDYVGARGDYEVRGGLGIHDAQVVPVAVHEVLHAEHGGVEVVLGVVVGLGDGQQVVPDEVVAVLEHLEALGILAPVVEGALELEVELGLGELGGVAQTLGGEAAEADGLGVGLQHELVEAGLRHDDVGAGAEGVLTAGEVLALDEVGGVYGIAPVVVLVDDGDLELVALIEIQLDGKGVELTLDGLHDEVVLRPCVAPVVFGVPGEAAGQHPGPLVDDRRLPGDEDGGVGGDGRAHVIGDYEGGSGIVALDHIALFGELGFGNGLALFDVDLGEHGGAVAVVESDLVSAGRGLAAVAAGGEGKYHNQREREAEQYAQLFHFMSSL